MRSNKAMLLNEVMDIPATTAENDSGITLKFQSLKFIIFSPQEFAISDVFYRQDIIDTYDIKPSEVENFTNELRKKLAYFNKFKVSKLSEEPILTIALEKFEGRIKHEDIYEIEAYFKYQ